ncbi:MAG: DUF362 domain-containing protein [Bacteroidales bacterium]|nr:DUF362 domain-containing protein [Bacteroidales bacterium]
MSTRSKVFFTDLHTKMYGDGLPSKLKSLIRAAGIADLDLDGKFVAVKIHFGEHGNVAHLRPQFAKAVVDVVKELGGKPFLTDCNTMYPGSRKNALEHLYCAWENGFTPLSCGCSIIIADGLKGTDEALVPVKGGEYIKEAKIGRAIMDADVFISLNHFKGHEFASLGGAIKNTGMGCGSRAGKKEQHSSGTAIIDESLCRGCRKCLAHCANGGLKFDEGRGKMTVTSNCVGCGHCLGACNFDAIGFENDVANEMLSRRMAEYAKAVVDGRPQFHINLLLDISPNCDCHSENDVPILPNIGMLASKDMLAIDQASVDLCQKAEPMPGSQLYDAVHSEDFHEQGNPFNNVHPLSDWKSCFDQAEKIGLGSREYELINVFTAH